MLRRHLTYANVMVTIAVFIALGGASYAAIKLPANSVGNRQLRSGAVTLSKIKASTRTSLRGRRGATGPAGAAGAAGPAGAQGAKGDTGDAGASALTSRTRIRWRIGSPTSAAADFTLERTTGSVTKVRDATVLRVTVQDTLRKNGGGGLCLFQVRVDGRNDAGSTDVNNDTGRSGTEAVSGVADEIVPVTSVAVFRDLPAGSHTIQIYLANAGATSCVENPDASEHTAIVEETD